MLAAPFLSWRAAGLAEAAGEIDVRTRGAKGDKETDDTRAIQAAIDDAGASGRSVRFPPGDYVAGTLRLQDHTTLRLDAGATLIASPRDGDFEHPGTPRYETYADQETSDLSFALLQGRTVKRLQIFGPGRIDGNRSRRSGPKPIALTSCADVEIRDLTIANAGNYNISLLGCERVNIQGVRIVNGYADGIDPDCCRNVRIAQCDIESRDDALCLKTSFALGARGTTENVRVSGCRLTTLHNAIKLGTESTGTFRNIAISDCVVTGRRHPWVGDLSSGIALESVDGGVLEHVSIWNIRMAGVRTPIFVRQGWRGRGPSSAGPGALRDVSIREVTATGALVASSITGISGHPVERIALGRIRVDTRYRGSAKPPSLQVDEMESRYPDAYMFDALPAYGLYCRHVAGLILEDLDLTVDRPDASAAVVLDDVREVRVRGVTGTTPAWGGPLLWLNEVQDAKLRDLRSRPGGTTVARVSGAATARMRLSRGEAKQVVQLDRDVRTSAVQIDEEPPATAGTGLR
jgi:hypothetical protein